MSAYTVPFINTESFKESFLHEMNKSLERAAEPVIQEALKRVEIEMRKAMAANLISVVESYVDFQTMTDRIVVTIRNVEKK